MKKGNRQVIASQAFFGEITVCSDDEDEGEALVNLKAT